MRIGLGKDMTSNDFVGQGSNSQWSISIKIVKTTLKTISTVRLLPKMFLIFTYFIKQSMLNPKVGRKLGVAELLF